MDSSSTNTADAELADILDVDALSQQKCTLHCHCHCFDFERRMKTSRPFLIAHRHRPNYLYLPTMQVKYYSLFAIARSTVLPLRIAYCTTLHRPGHASIPRSPAK
jgi:hypothetical protein